MHALELRDLSSPRYIHYIREINTAVDSPKTPRDLWVVSVHQASGRGIFFKDFYMLGLRATHTHTQLSRSGCTFTDTAALLRSGYNSRLKNKQLKLTK